MPASRVELGRVVKPHGLKGEVVVSGVRITPEELLTLAEIHAVGPDGARRPLTVKAVRPFMQSLLVLFEGVEDVDQARLLHGQVLEVDRDRLPPAGDGTVYLFQLVGLAVATEEGEDLGKVTDVFQTGTAPILVVRGARERMIPLTMATNVDTAAGTVTVRLLPGMDDL